MCVVKGCVVVFLRIMFGKFFGGKPVFILELTVQNFGIAIVG